MASDCLIKNVLVVDGSDAEPYTADVALAGGRGFGQLSEDRGAERFLPRPGPNH